MAPRRGGGGGGGGGGGVKSCSEYAFMTHSSVVFLVYYVLFTVAVIGILWAAVSIWMKHPHAKRILGGTYFPALIFTLLGHLLYWIFLVVDECGASVTLEAYTGVWITYEICWWLGEILLFVVLVWTLNTALQQRLGGLQQTLFQIISWAAIGIVAVIGATLISINSYNTWEQLNDRYSGYSYNDQSLDLRIAAVRLNVAYYALYLVGALIGCTLALLSLHRLRSQARVTGLMVWIIVFTLSLVIYCLIIISISATRLDGKWIRENTQYALSFLTLFFFHLAFVAGIFIAKAGVFSPQAGPYPPASYEQPAYNGPQYGAVPQQNGTGYATEQSAQLPNNQHTYHGQNQLDGTQRHEVKG